jgi:hypothetical protein
MIGKPRFFLLRSRPSRWVITANSSRVAYPGRPPYARVAVSPPYREPSIPERPETRERELCEAEDGFLYHCQTHLSTSDPLPSAPWHDSRGETLDISANVAWAG